MNLFRLIFNGLTVLALVLLSITATTGMAERLKAEQAYAALGLSFESDDFCTDSGTAHGECPLCHKIERPFLPQAPSVTQNIAFILKRNLGLSAVATDQDLQAWPWVRGPPDQQRG